MERVLLIDGDVIAFKAASAAQDVMTDFDGFIKPFANKAQGEAIVENMLFTIERDLKGDRKEIYLSDPEANWRWELMPDYKGNREEEWKGSARPLLLAYLKNYLREKYNAAHWPALEADDTLGILMTAPKSEDVELVLVGKDKDFNTIPGLHHQLDMDGKAGFRKVREVTPAFAQYFHLVQTLAGDAVDGYKGCPGIGMKRAKDIVADPHLLVPEHGVVTRGPRNGQRTTKWVRKPANGNLWGCVVSQYAKAGVKNPEKAALLTARIAHILQWGDYNQETGAVTLWVPPASIGGRHVGTA